MSLNDWKNRWKITGVLTTVSPLHIGDGGETELKTLEFKKDVGEGKDKSFPVRIASLITDVNGKPYIPGSTLKGNLRAWLEENAATHIVDALLGSRDSARKDAVGGKCEFWNARVTGQTPIYGPNAAPPWWNPLRLTGVWAGVAIDRLTGVAENKKLFHHEFVPSGVSFAVTITAQNLSDEEVGALLNALGAFNSHIDAGDILAIGASARNGWGRMNWILSDAVSIDAPDVKEWLNEPNGRLWEDIPGKSRKDSFKAWPPQVGKAPLDRIVVDLELRFEGPFLVNDPSQTKNDGEKDDRPDHAPLRDPQGRAFLPAQSFRGAFRSQSERILRTIGGGRAACTGAPGADGIKSCKAVYQVKKIATDLCPACRVFGGPGWSSPVEVSDFTGVAEDQHFFQDFVAIDRFTGGAADKAKFDALAAYRPVLKGTLSVDLRSLKKAGIGSWVLGLIALTMRDLISCGISFGFGAAKGYGRCNVHATVGGRDLSENWAALISGGVKSVDEEWIKPLWKTVEAWVANP